MRRVVLALVVVAHYAAAASGQPIAELDDRLAALRSDETPSPEVRDEIRRLLDAVKDAERDLIEAVVEDDQRTIENELRAGLDLRKHPAILPPAAGQASPETLRLLLRNLSTGAELESWHMDQFWTGVGMREDDEILRVAAEKLTPEDWSREALDLAVRYGAWQVISNHYSLVNARAHALLDGRLDLASALDALEPGNLSPAILRALRTPNVPGERGRQPFLLALAREHLRPEDLSLIVDRLLTQGQRGMAIELIEQGVPPSGTLEYSIPQQDDIELALHLSRNGHPMLSIWQHAFQLGAENVFWGIFVEEHPKLESIDDAQAMDPKIRALTWLGLGLDPFYAELREEKRSPGDYSVDPNLRDWRGKTGLLNSMLGNRMKLMEVYLDAGADPNLCADETCPIYVAAKYGNLALIQSLRRHGMEADPESASASKAARMYWKRRTFNRFTFEQVPVDEPIGISMKLPLDSIEQNCSIESSHLLCEIDEEDWVVGAGDSPDEGRGVFVVSLDVRPDPVRKVSLIFHKTFGLEVEVDEPRVSSSLRRDPEGEDDAWIVQIHGTRGYAECDVQVVGHAATAPEVHELARRVFRSVGTVGIVSLAPQLRILTVGACALFLVLVVLFRRRLEG